MQLDRNTFPKGGWQFYQPETDWSLPNPLNYSFHAAASLIAAHRRANPALVESSSLQQAEADLEAYTKARLGMNTVPGQSFRYEEPPPKPCGTCG